MPAKASTTKTTTKTDTRNTREDWLQQATELLRPLFVRVSSPIPDHVHVSVGFPSVRALSAKKRAIGECWHTEASADGLHHVFISPVVHEPIQVLAVLAHELVHAAVGTKAGHRAPF
jgi:hypothetical protein